MHIYVFSVCFQKNANFNQANLLKNQFPQSINVHSKYKTLMVPVSPIHKFSSYGKLTKLTFPLNAKGWVGEFEFKFNFKAFNLKLTRSDWCMQSWNFFSCLYMQNNLCSRIHVVCNVSVLFWRPTYMCMSEFYFNVREG